jgi:hypothetical protein
MFHNYQMNYKKKMKKKKNKKTVNNNKNSWEILIKFHKIYSIDLLLINQELILEKIYLKLDKRL